MARPPLNPVKHWQEELTLSADGIHQPITTIQHRGGLLFVTTPALQQFWSYNDELAHHLRRYTRADFARLGEQAGLQLLDARYFMFLLSPLYWLARQGKGIEGMTDDEKMALMHKTHQVPPTPLNLPLTAIFAAETPLGHWLRFPWAISVLGVFRQ